MCAPLRLVGRVGRCVPLFVLSVAAVFVLVGTSAAQDLLVDEPTQQEPLDAQEQVRQLMEQGQQALEEGDWVKALASYDPLIRALRQQPIPQTQALAVFHVNRGRAFVGLEDIEAALADFNAALEAEPNFLPALILRGQLYLEQGAPDVALGDFQLAVEQDRGNMDVLFGLGKAYALLGGSSQALKPLNYFLAQNEEHAEAYRLRAQAHAGLGKYPEAYEDMERSLRFDPDDYETHFTLGAIYLREEKFAEASKAFAESIRRYEPKPGTEEPYIQGYLIRAATLIEQGKKSEDEAEKQAAYEAALTDCDELLEQLGELPQYLAAVAATEYRRGVALRMMGRLRDAINALTEAINRNPELGEAYFRRGICFYYIDENELATADFQQAAIITYDDPRARLWEGFSLSKAGNYNEAVRAYGQAIAESDRYVPAYVNRGLAYMMLDEYDKAIIDFNDAIRLEPTEAHHYFKRGMAYLQLGDYQMAADSFASAVKFDDKYAPAYRHAADAFAALGRNELAAEYRSKAAELEPAANGR